MFFSKTTNAKSNRFGKLAGAAFLMATSAIGPGFITQTTVFTQQLFTSFGFVILLSILFDVVVQLNIWRIVAATRLPAVAIANTLHQAVGFVLVFLVSAGGLIFNIGNIGGCGLGLNTLFGTDVRIGAMISGLIAIGLFVFREFGKTMDAFTKVLALVMLTLTLYTAIQSHPPIGDVLHRAVLPERIDVMAVMTLVGGTVGGYISFAGAQRMLDTVLPGVPDLQQVQRSAINGVLIAGVMRMLLFIAAIGVIASGISLRADNPAASVFQAAAGDMGLKIFGIVLWSAAITSVVGAAYTSVSFLQNLHPFIKANRRWFIIAFIVLSTCIFSIAGNPVNILVKAGAVNAFILPFSLSVMLIAASRYKSSHNYHHPLWLTISGWVVVVLLTIMSIKVITGSFF